MSCATLPRLLYLGDVPVSNTIAGASLLYRLLLEYPPDRLRICGPPVAEETALPEVRYDATIVSLPRLLRTRFAPWYCGWITWRLQWIPAWLRRVAAEFRPEAVLTVSQTGRWLAAARLAEALEVPLLLVAHDDHAYEDYLPRPLRPWISRQFGSVYSSAAARFCISPTMRDVYAERYGADAKVLYPGRDPRYPASTAPPARVARVKDFLTFAYAGSLHDAESFLQLGEFCSLVESLGHRVLIHSPQVEEMRRRLPLAAPIESVRGPVSPEELGEILRTSADVLLVLGSFGEDQREIVNTLFPSKMADYTAMGLPILCWAPHYASITRFVREFPGVALSCIERDPSSLRTNVERLRTEPALRRDLATEALRIGARFFSPSAAWEVFHPELMRVTKGVATHAG